METAIQRLSSGLRINSAKDDTAGSAISQRMQNQIRGQRMASNNIKQGTDWWTRYKLTKLMRLAAVTRKRLKIKSCANAYQNRAKNDERLLAYRLRLKGNLHLDLDVVVVDETTTAKK